MKTRLLVLTGALTLLALSGATLQPAVGASMGDPVDGGSAQQMFLSITGIRGESQDQTHQGLIDVLAWSWGLTNTVQGNGGAAGKVNIKDFTITKYIDKSSVELMLAVATGKHFPEVKLIVRKAGQNPLEYMIITMTDVLITAVDTGGSGDEQRSREHVSFTFQKIAAEYKEQRADGSAGDTHSAEITRKSGN